jgi:hypothetical protein
MSPSTTMFENNRSIRIDGFLRVLVGCEQFGYTREALPSPGTLRLFVRPEADPAPAGGRAPLVGTRAGWRARFLRLVEQAIPRLAA